MEGAGWIRRVRPRIDNQVPKNVREPGKRVAQSFFGFQAVVENDDRSRPCTAQHALQAFVRLDTAIVILAQDIPHDDPETFAQRPDLRQSDATVGRTKQPGSDTAITFLNLAQIGTGRGVPAVDMMFRVIAYRVTAGLQALQQLGVLPDVFAHHKESRLRLMTLQFLQHPGRHLRNGPVVERQVKDLFRGLHPPEQRTKELLKQQHGLKTLRVPGRAKEWSPSFRAGTRR